MATVTNALKSGDQVVIPGFGSFSTGNRSARTGRNPQTGKVIQIKHHELLSLKRVKILKSCTRSLSFLGA